MHFLHSLCFIFIYVHVVSCQITQEIVENGRLQYQLLQERAKLPQYGSCWKSAVMHIDAGCRSLSEETQSTIALHLTNCFLEMSGLETYNCELDKKPNLKAICVSSMSEKAFMVYTEFYTHTQNICWFLHGQMWHEKILTSTIRVGTQLDQSADQQQKLLEQQQRSLHNQEQLLKYGSDLEGVLKESQLQAQKVVEEFRTSTLHHQHILTLIINSLSDLQSWLVGEVSWIDTIIFYITTAIIVTLLTSIPRTSSARLPILLLFSINAGMERLICNWMISNLSEIQVQMMQKSLNSYVWWCRKTTVFISVVYFAFHGYFYQDYFAENNRLLRQIHEQNSAIMYTLETFSGKQNIAIEKLNENSSNITGNRQLPSNLQYKYTKWVLKANLKEKSSSREPSESTMDGIQESASSDSKTDRAKTEANTKKYYFRNRQKKILN